MKKVFRLFLALVMVFGLFTSIPKTVVAEGEIDLEKINKFLNESAALGEGSKANPVAIIPINHIDGPGNEDQFYAFVNFKYAARDYVKYQVTYISCTCREASVNYWQTAYVELTYPESKKIEDAEIKALSFDKDPKGKYNGGFWGDSDPIPNGVTYEQIKTEYIPFFIGKKVSEINGLNTIKDIDLAKYQEGEGRSAYTIDLYTGATVSTNNIIRMLQAITKFHGTDSYFGDGAAMEAGSNAGPVASSNTEAKVESPAATVEKLALPAPVDTSKTYKKSKEATEMTPCDVSSFKSDCSSINKDTLINYLDRDDVLYIDLRDYVDYGKKHFKNFEVIPFFAYIYDAEAHTNKDKIQLYGGTPQEPVAVYEESDKILEAMFPKDKTIFLMCQSGGRVSMLMDILKAKGYDMSKIYNIGGVAQYTAGQYRPFITDLPELGIEAKYSFEGLTRIAPQ